VVYAWCRQNAAARGVEPIADPSATVDRVAKLLSDEA